MRQLAVAFLIAICVGCRAPQVTTPVGAVTVPAATSEARPRLIPVPERAPEPVRVVTTAADSFLVYERPAQGGPDELLARNDWGQPIALPVLGGAHAGGEPWLHVRLPDRPNGSTGWLRAGDLRTRLVHERIVVDLSDHTLIRLSDGEPVQRLRVGIGTPAFPTSPGRFFIWARLRYDSPGTYGVGALGLSGFSEVITDWVGGGRMAIHGTSDATDRGRGVSHGCVRVFNAQMARLADVPMGTPVRIRP